MCLTGECDSFQPGPFEVHFPNGTTRVKFPINLTDDDVYEGDESFTLAIVNNLPNLVVLGTPYRATVVVRDDEKSKQFMLSNLYGCLDFC